MSIMLKSGYFQMWVFYKIELNYCWRTLELSEFNTFEKTRINLLKSNCFKSGIAISAWKVT